MEPYSPFVDKIVCGIITMNGQFLELGPKMKKELLGLPSMDVDMDGQKGSLMNVVQRTTASLKAILPPKGNIGVMCIADEQFG